MIILAVILGACASSKLKIRVDLFKGETDLTRPMTIEQIAEIKSGISRSHVQAKDLAADKLAIATAMKNLYDFYYKEILADTALTENDELYAKYVREIELHRQFMTANYDSVNASIDSFMVIKRQKLIDIDQRQDLLQAQKHALFYAADMERNIRDIISPPVTGEFESIEYNQVRVLLENTFTPTNLALIGIDSDSLWKTSYPSLLGDLAVTIDKLVSESVVKLERSLDHLDEVSEAIATKDLTHLERSKRKIISSLYSVESDLTRPSTVAGVVRAKVLMESQSQRLEDLADPIWRSIVQEKNNMWRKEFSKTLFKAEGNSSVVMVKDDAVTYRIQQGSNNPAALVQSQLKITRSVAQAGIKIASSFAGVPFPADASDPDDKTSPKLKPDYQSAAGMEAAMRASNARKLDLLQALSGPMATYQSASNEEKIQIKKEVSAMLKAYEMVYSPPKPAAGNEETSDVDSSAGTQEGDSTNRETTPKDSTPVPQGELKLGDKGEVVTQLQEALKKAGYEITVDGDFGPSTKAVVEQLQRDGGLAVDGVFGAASRGYLLKKLEGNQN